jgi:hypothetical protein
MQNELRTRGLLVNVEILGINGAQYYSPLSTRAVTAGRSLAWMQDSASENVWRNWSAAYRDVHILDTSNRVVGVYNLSLHDLANASNYETLRDMFIAAANAGDADHDKIPDHWEEHYLKAPIPAMIRMATTSPTT